MAPPALVLSIKFDRIRSLVLIHRQSNEVTLDNKITFKLEKLKEPNLESSQFRSERERAQVKWCHEQVGRIDEISKKFDRIWLESEKGREEKAVWMNEKQWPGLGTDKTPTPNTKFQSKATEQLLKTLREVYDNSFTNTPTIPLPVTGSLKTSSSPGASRHPRGGIFPGVSHVEDSRMCLIGAGWIVRYLPLALPLSSTNDRYFKGVAYRILLRDGFEVEVGEEEVVIGTMKLEWFDLKNLKEAEGTSTRRGGNLKAAGSWEEMRGRLGFIIEMIELFD